jgi:hypothetical protein
MQQNPVPLALNASLRYSSVFTWCVTYVFEPPVRLLPGEESIEHSGVELLVEASAIVGLKHTIDCDADVSRDEVVQESAATLACLLSAFRYLQLKAFNYWGDAVRVSPPESRIRITGRATGTTGTRPIRLPRAACSSSSPDRLADWLQMAADAQESASPAAALRHYFVILEELVATSRGQYNGYDCIKAMRDFVSHSQVSYASTIATIERCAPSLPKTGNGYQYQPSSPLQRRLVDEWRGKARALVDGELQLLLGFAGPDFHRGLTRVAADIATGVRCMFKSRVVAMQQNAFSLGSNTSIGAQHESSPWSFGYPRSRATCRRSRCVYERARRTRYDRAPRHAVPRLHACAARAVCLSAACQEHFYARPDTGRLWDDSDVRY